MSEKTKGELLKEKLTFSFKNAYEIIDEKKEQQVYDYCEGYKQFLDLAKTERESVRFAVSNAEKNGFKSYEDKKVYSAGDKIYYVNRNKAIILAVIGEQGLENGVNIAAAHIDSPRLDLKPNPLYEESELAMLKTHYYGGIKKYQWTAIPLSLCGIVIKKDGECVDVRIGEDKNDPVFCVTDLLPHLAKDQMDKPLRSSISGESLNVLVGSKPFADDKASEKVKLNVLNILFEKYGICEKDFYSAELELVPNFTARDVGFDRSLIGAYGHDDRVCAYPCLTAIFECGTPKKTCISVLADKEEIGSVGNTGLDSDYMKNFIISLCRSQNADELICFKNSKCLSADVNAAYDPNYPEAYDSKNSAYINKGAVITKYTGHGGKSGSSDASAEFMRYVMNTFDNANVVYQSGELGKVDQGGGGTVALYIAHLNIDVVDLGVPVLSMHAPFEIVSKSDVFMTHEGIKAFYMA